MRVVGIAVVLARLGWWIAPAVLAVTVPFVLLGIRSGQRVYELERRVSRWRRRAGYLAEEVLQGRDAAAERALFGYSDYVKTRWRSVFEAVVKLEMLWNVRIWVRFKSAGGVAIAGIILAMLAFLRPLQAGVIDVAFYVAAVMALMQAERVVAQELVQITSRLAQHREFLGDLSTLSALPETPRALIRRPPHQAFEALEFAGVSFTYPGAEEPVLTEVSFTLERGRHYALVGANGTGKSTITRLMLGLYRPGGGRIVINGTPIGDWSQEELNGLFGVVFQDFARYALTVRDNVTWAFPSATAGSWWVPACGGRGSTRRWPVFPEAPTPRSARCCRGAWTCRAASGSGWRWPAPWPARRRCASSTSPPRPSIRSPRAKCTAPTPRSRRD